MFTDHIISYRPTSLRHLPFLFSINNSFRKNIFASYHFSYALEIKYFAGVRPSGCIVAYVAYAIVFLDDIGARVIIDSRFP